MATLSYRKALAIWFADVEALLTAQLLYAAERCVAAHHDADVGYFGIGQHVPCIGGLRNEVLPVLDAIMSVRMDRKKPRRETNLLFTRSSDKEPSSPR
jgi:hypothetical protein